MRGRGERRWKRTKRGGIPEWTSLAGSQHVLGQVSDRGTDGSYLLEESIEIGREEGRE